MSSTARAVVYWDTSAILSALFKDAHSEAATAHTRLPATHFVSSLGWAETHAILARLERERALATVLLQAARESFASGLWRRLAIVPEWKQIERLARAWPLRGADLWHLAAAKDLQADLPELALLSFDVKLMDAAKGEGLA